MSQKFNRYEKVGGHLVSAIPSHFVCAECGGVLMSQFDTTEPLQVIIQCAKHLKHIGIETGTPAIERSSRPVSSREADRHALFGEE